MKNVREPGVIAQVRTAAKNPVALAIGALLGGFVPAATYMVAHNEAKGFNMAMCLVIGGLVYSAKTVFQWGRMAFNDTAKALGFVLLIEGVMVTSKTGWLALAALAYLVSINAVATGCLLALRDAPPAAKPVKTKKVAEEKVVEVAAPQVAAPKPKRTRKARRDTIPAPMMGEESGEFEIEAEAV